MRIYKLALLLIFLKYNWALAERLPRIEKIGSSYSLVLSTEMESNLKEVSPSFKQYAPNDFPKEIIKSYKFSDKQMLSAVIGDFNGDGKSDVIVLGADKDGDITYKIISTKERYKILPSLRHGDSKRIPAFYFPDSKWVYGMQYFELRAPGSHFSGLQHAGKKDKCPNDGVAITSNADGTRTMNYCWKNEDLKWDNESGD